MQKAIDERVEELASEKYFINFNELCSYLNLSKPVIDERLIKQGLPHYRVGTKYLFKKDEVNQFLDDITANMNIGNNDFKFYSSLKK